MIFAYNTINDRLEKLTDQIINTPNLNEIADGKYTGEASVFPVSVKVGIEVKKHRIVTIDMLKHTNGQGNEAEEIIERVLSKQQLNVDVITGATYSSKVILLAIEDALKP